MKTQFKPLFSTVRVVPASTCSDSLTSPVLAHTPLIGCAPEQGRLVVKAVRKEKNEIKFNAKIPTT